MAKLRYSVLVDDVRKRMGNVVFTKWKKTPVVRIYVNQRKSNTPDQLRVRGFFTKCVALWKTLPESDKNSWRREARDLNMSGYNLFLSVNTQRLSRSEPSELTREEIRGA